jgi:endonuclease/exonuclease/phosphatase family metal-dependent hydrolase
MERGGVSGTEAGAEALSETPVFGTTVVNRPARAARRTLKAIVFNARSGARFEGILACLRRPPLAGADVIMLCEADWQLRRSFDREIAADLAAELDMSFAYGPEFAIRRPPGGAPSFLGNAILTSAPLADARMIALPTTRMSRRYAHLIGQPHALIATAKFGGRQVTIAVAHLHSRWNPAGRARQMAQLLEYLAPLDAVAGGDAANAQGAVILGGDFNTTTTDLYAPWGMAMVAVQMATRPWRFRYPEPYEPLFAELARGGFKVRGANVPGKPTFTFSRAIPPALRPKLDWIALRGLEPMPGSARVVAARESFFGPRVSDHDFVMCEVRL